MRIVLILSPLALKISILFACALSLSACGTSARSEAIVATTGIAADITRQLVGSEADVIQLVPDGASPHSYAISTREQAELESSKLLVAFGSGLEQGLPLDRADRRFEFSEELGIDPGADPHIWMDPTLIAEALPGLIDALSEVDPDQASVYRRRGATYARQLQRLDREITDKTATIPKAQRLLVTSHDLLGRFAERYGFGLSEAAFGSAPEAEVSTKRLRELINLVDKRNIPAVFAADGDNPIVLDRISDFTGAEVVDDLLLEGFGPAADTYVEMMRYSADQITEALR